MTGWLRWTETLTPFFKTNWLEVDRNLNLIDRQFDNGDQHINHKITSIGQGEDKVTEVDRNLNLIWTDKQTRGGQYLNLN